MGTLYWQLNDNWPVCSWSSIEYNGSWKLLHYAARRFFAPLLLCAWIKDGQVEVILVNDLPSEARAKVTVSVVEFDGRTASKESIDARAAAGSARRLKSGPLAELASRPEAAFLHLALEHDGETRYNELFLAEPKRWPLSRASVTLEASAARAEGAFTIRLSADAPAFYVSLDAGEIPGEFSDNCFTMLAGTTRTVEFRPSTAKGVILEKVRRGLSVRHLRDTYK